jgi:glycosyltransferase involved in cell wall biosynthesis
MPEASIRNPASVRPRNAGSIGVVSPSGGDAWLGGVYVVHHYLRNAALLPEEESVQFRDLWWREQPEVDPFDSLRSQLGNPLVLKAEQPFLPRLATAIGRRLTRRSAIGQRLHHAQIRALFPVSPFDDDSVPLIFLLPDFQYRHLAAINDDETCRFFDNLYRVQGERARLIILLSESARRDLQRFMPDLEHKARVVFPRAVPSPEWYEGDPDEARQRFHLPDRYFVISNQVSAHKNHRTIARAVAALRREGTDVHVVCTGRTQDYRDTGFFDSLDTEVKELGIEDRFRFLGVVPRPIQLSIMRSAVAVIQPSLFEGWGAAVAEAKALGKPLLLSRLEVHEEHQANVFRWIEAEDVRGWSDAMRDANRELAPGIDRLCEEEAAEEAKTEGIAAGRTLVEAFREYIDV